MQGNLKVRDASATIASRRDEITKALNEDMWPIEGSTEHWVMVGSYGRHTAIRGVSDLDTIFVLPFSLHASCDDENGPRKVLNRIRDALKARYPNTQIRVDRCVVRIEFTSKKFELRPSPPWRNRWELQLPGRRHR